MAEYLWSKSNDENEPPSGAVQEFLSGADIELDRVIFEFDLGATAAHARGLARIGLLSDDEAGQLTNALSELRTLFKSGQFRLEAPFEDGHSAIEAWLTERLGEIGRKVHTGRSRNDQVQTAVRLYLRHRLDQLANLCGKAAEQFLSRARDGENMPMPGYTHLQRAVPSTVGLWMASFAESFIDTGFLARLTRDWINVSPLALPPVTASTWTWIENQLPANCSLIEFRSTRCTCKTAAGRSSCRYWRASPRQHCP